MGTRRGARRGGLGEPRLTRDIDVAIAVDSDSEAESIVRVLCMRGWRLAEVVEHEERHRLSTARLHSTDADLEGMVLDILFASSGIEPEIARAALRVELLPGITLPVAPRPHLLAMKLLARDDRHRPQDADDLRSLIRSAAPEEIDEARRLVRVIEERRFNPKRDLVAALEHALVESS